MVQSYAIIMFQASLGSQVPLILSRDYVASISPSSLHQHSTNSKRSRCQVCATDSVAGPLVCIHIRAVRIVSS